MAPDTSITPDLVQAQSFTTAFRGYDTGEVKAFLNRVANELKAWREKAEGLESAWHSAEERAARPPVLDEDTLMAAVGEETATILRTARAAAAEMRTRAAEESERALTEAREEAERILSEAREEAERARHEAVAEADRLRQEAESALAAATAAAEQQSAELLGTARQEAAEMVERAGAEAESIRAAAERERQLTIEGANSTRDRILEDLSRRRRVATVQIEQLRAGRERLIESYAIVRRTLEEVQNELSRADAEARAAADDVGRRMRDEPSEEWGGEAAGEDAAGHPPAEAAAPGETAPPDETGAPTQMTAVVEAVTEVTARTAATDVPPDPAAETATEPASAVDELFARIRGTNRPEGAGPSEGDPAPGGARSRRSAKKRAAGGEDERAEDQVAGVKVEEAETTGEPPVPDGDEVLLQAREFAVVELESTLTRRLKRALQDEQNDVLDRLRGLKSVPTPQALLPEEEAQVGRYASAAAPLLAEAATAGAVFADETLGSPGRDAPVNVDVADLARECATGIVSALRRRLEQAIELGAGDDQAVLVESLGGAYREWKTQRIERLAGDALSAAFSRGTWHAAPEGARLRWVVEDVDGPCPDCDDDALAGLIPKGEAFPTGQPHPPAHTGCRCLLVPSRAGS